ncbi:RdRP-domain-containing protein [Armillaria novae-zelandiae]|uniref:RNA-dependent RNA polymerase n=1 Tax=Armillaria novae-zelandiae TaxID=153914 RepID=A0AA39UM55_9AGAR|nr:RdRP-domain-containing protein [Armillaria novae-zelandiae]
MEVFVRNIPFSVSEEDLRVHLANKIHIPPIQNPDSPLLNFGLELFRQPGSAAHRGFGIVTFPNTNSATIFLQLYSVMSIGRGSIYFQQSREPTNQVHVASLASRPWVDPEPLRQERVRRENIAKPSPRITIHLGRICRKGIFASESTIKGQVICDPDLRRLRIDVEPESFSEDDFDDDPLSLRNLLGELYDTRLRFWYRASNIRTLAVSEDGIDVYVQSSIPATIEMETTNIEFSGPPRVSRCPTLHNGARLMPLRVTQGLCLCFSTQAAAYEFIHRCKEMHMPPYIHPHITRIERGQAYRSRNWTALQTELRSLSFPLAFEVEKAYGAGVLDVSELLSLCGALHELEAHHGKLTATSVFRQFASILDIPSLRSTVHTQPVANATSHASTSSHAPGRQQVPNPRSPQSGTKSSRKRRNRRTRKRQLAATASHRAEEDLTGLLHEAVEAYIAETRAPRRRFAPSAATYQAFHLVVTPTMQVLAGPLPDQSNSVLRRYNNNGAFLRVSFQDEDSGKPRRDESVSIDGLLQHRYQPILTGGVIVAGRKFDFLGYSMSGLKEYSFTFVRPFKFQGRRYDADTIRKELGDFSQVIHRPALLGARWGQMFSTSLPSVEISPDMIRRIPDRTAGSGLNALFTDGCSTISRDLMIVVKDKILRRTEAVPSALQFRLGGAKGVLVLDPNLTGTTLTLRPSQIKFDSENMRSLDVITTSAKPIYCYLNRPLIALLEHHKVPNRSFKVLQDLAINEARHIRQSLDAAATTLAHHGLGSSFHLESLFRNMSRILKVELSEQSDSGSYVRYDLLTTVITYASTYILRVIKHHARIRIPGSYTLLGVSDEWDCLQEGEIYATIFDPRTNEKVAVEGRVIVTRSPQIHPGDVQFATAVRRPALNHLTNVVVFSCRGNRSLPSCLGGGDLDGDIYNIILDKSLHPPQRFTASPGAYKRLASDIRPYPCGKKEVADFVIRYIQSDVLGYICTLHLRISDLKGLGCEDCLILAEKASHAVDYPKVGTPVNMKDLPKPTDRHRRPDYMSGEGVNPNDNGGRGFYPSKKILGMLYRRVPVEESRPYQDEGGFVDHELLDDLLEPHLNVVDDLNMDPDENNLEEMRHILDEYCQQLSTIAKAHTVSKGFASHLSEAELVCGCIMEHYTDHKKRMETAKSMNFQTEELTRAIRREFKSPEEDRHEGFDDDDDDDEFSAVSLNERDIRHLCIKFNRARAGWVVAQEALDDAREEKVVPFGPESFSVIALGAMLDVLKELKKPLILY